MQLGSLYSWLVFAHVIGVLGFLAVHGASVMVAFRLRRERSPERIRALLDLSSSGTGVMYAFLALFLFAGLAAGINGGWFTGGRLWLWVSLVLTVLMIVVMYIRASAAYTELRKAAGLPFFEGRKTREPVAPVRDDELADLARRLARPAELSATGFGGVAMITFLMMFKPF